MGKDQDLLQAVKEQDAQAVVKILGKAGKTGKKLIGSTKKLNINYQDGDGMSSLHQASLMGNTGIMRHLLEAGAQVGVKDNKGMSPLHYAAWQGLMDPVRLLLHWMAPVNEQAFNGDLPLHLACQHGHVHVVNALLTQHANPTARNKEYKTPLDLACEFGRYGVVEILLHCNVCQVLLEDNPQDMKDNFRTTCIHSAAKNGHTEIIKLLLQAGINMNRITLQGTSLHEAAKYGNVEAVKLLLDCGADVNKPNSYDQTPLDLVNKFTTSKAAKDLKKILKEASFAVYARAIRDNYSSDQECLSFKEGDYITILEQNPIGLWKGYVVKDAYMARPGFFPADKVVLVENQDAENAAIQYNFSNGAPPQYQYEGSLLNHNTERGRSSWDSAEEMRSAGLSKENLTFSNRNSSASCDSGRGVSTGQLDSRVVHSTVGAHVHNQHRLSCQSYESGVSSRRSCHSNSSSSLGSLDKLEESGFSSQVNVAELFQAGLTDAEVLMAWLSDLQFDEYLHNFLHAGYDMPTISRMTPEDLTAIGITKPAHRKRLKAEIARLSICDGIPDYKPADVLDWLRMLKLDCYYETLLRQGFDNIDVVTDITWEDLEEIGIRQLGHQKKMMLAVDRLKRLTLGVKRLSNADCQRSCESLDSPASVMSVEMIATPQYSQEVSITRISTKKSPSGDNLSRNSSEMTTFQQQPRDAGLGSSASSLNSSEYACVSPVTSSCQHQSKLDSEHSAHHSKSGSSTPVHMEENLVDRHIGYVINNVDNLEFSSKVPLPNHPSVAPKPKPVAKIIGKPLHSSYDGSIDSGHHSGEGSGQTTPTNTLKKNSSVLRAHSPKLTKENMYAEPVKAGQPPSSAPLISQYNVSKPRTSSPYGTMVSAQNGVQSTVYNMTSTSSINAPVSPAHLASSPGNLFSSKTTTMNSAGNTNPNSMSTSAPNGSVIYQSGSDKKKIPPPPPPKRSNSMTESTTIERNGVNDSVDSPSIINVPQDDAFASCVKNLSARFGKMRGERKEENSLDTASSSDSEEFPPPPPPIAMEIITPKIESYGIIGKSMKGALPRDSPERAGAYPQQKHNTSLRNNSFGDWSGNVGTLPHRRLSEQERLKTESESATLMRPSKTAGRDCKGGTDLNVSSVSIDSNTLPFANENVGTIKQRVPVEKPSIVQSEDCYSERNLGLNSNLFEDRQQRGVEQSRAVYHGPQTLAPPKDLRKAQLPPPIAKKPALSKPSPGQNMLQQPIATNQHSEELQDAKQKRSTETGDVLNDIDNMLADLTEELDAMLELEME